MGYFASDPIIEEIKERFNIVNLIETYVSLKRSGRGYVGLCPFHNEKTPSFQVSEEKGIFHCFGCGTGGDIFGFMMRYNNFTFPEAVVELAKRAGLTIEKDSLHPQKKSRKDTLFKLNMVASKFYHTMMVQGNEGRSAAAYLQERGIPLEIAKEFQLGYAPREWDTLVKYLSAKRAPLDIAQEVGLIIGKKSKDGYYDRFRDRIIFPIRDVDGRVLGFGGRTLAKEEPKYMNSPESEIYRKRNILYGLDKARDSIRKERQVIVVEGYMDLLSLYVAGIRNVVASLGTALTRDQVTLLRRYTDRVVVVFDGDESGIRAALRVLEVFLEESLSPLMVVLPEGDDPDLFISKGKRDEFLKLIAGADSLLDFFVERILTSFRRKEISRTKTVESVIEVISKVKNPIEKSHYIRRIAENLGIRENEFLSLIGRMEKARMDTRVELKKTSEAQEKLLLKILLKFPSYSRYLKEKDIIHFIPDGEIKTILEEIILNGFNDISSLLLSFDNASAQEIISEAIFSSDEILDEATGWKMLKDCIRKLRLKTLEDQLSLLRLQVDRARREKNNNLEEKLIREYRDLTEQEKSIKGETHED
jgi:DNA primase